MLLWTILMTSHEWDHRPRYAHPRALSLNFDNLMSAYYVPSTMLDDQDMAPAFIQLSQVGRAETSWVIATQCGKSWKQGKLIVYGSSVCGVKNGFLQEGQPS